MKKRILSILLTFMMSIALMTTFAFTIDDISAQADTITVTYSIFDAVIPFKNMVDCQRTTNTTIGKMQQLNGFAYVYSAKHDQQIHYLVPDVITNPDNYYYKFSEGSNERIVLTMYKYNDSSYSYVLSDNGYIQTYGDNCFLYVAGRYGSFVSFRDKEYHMCTSSHTHTNKYPHENVSSLDSSRKNCILCGCGETFIIRGYNPSISDLKELPMVEGLVEIEHEHKYDETTGKCPCGEVKETHNHCVCGSSHKAVGDHTAETTVVWQPISSAEDFSKNKDSGYYYLTKDIEISAKWDFTKEREIVLCLNGHNISYAGSGNVSFISGSSTLDFTLTDCQSTPGKIQGFKNTYGGAIKVNKAFTIYNGVITGNSATQGGGVYIDQNANFYMYGGEISGNTAGSLAGGVYVKGNFEVAGAPKVNGNSNSNTETTYPSSMCKYTKNIYLSVGAVQIGAGGLTEGTDLDITPRFPVTANATPENITIAEGSTSDYSKYFSYTSKHEYTKQYDAATKEIRLNYIAPPPPTVTVAFDMQGHGQQISPQVIEKGTCAQEPPEPTEDGYRFLGWEDDYGAWDFGYEVWVDTTLYAKWAQVPYTITFDANGGSGDMAPQTFYKGQSQALKPNVFTRFGFEFTGWNTKADGSGTPVADGANITISSNGTLYAQWNLLNPLRITQQPEDQNVAEGKRAEFSIEANGDGLTYQWYVNYNDEQDWQAIDGATDPILLTPVVKLENDGLQFGCLIRDQHGNALRSDVAVLHVSKAPAAPKTGDDANFVLWTALIAMSTIGIITLRKRKEA